MPGTMRGDQGPNLLEIHSVDNGMFVYIKLITFYYINIFFFHKTKHHLFQTSSMNKIVFWFFLLEIMNSTGRVNDNVLS